MPHRVTISEAQRGEAARGSPTSLLQQPAAVRPTAKLQIAPPAGDFPLTVVILATDPVRRRLELSVRRAMPSPWLDPGRRPVPGDVLEVTVTGTKPLGVFATTELGIDGLIHYSSLPDDDLPDGSEERGVLLEVRYPIGTPPRERRGD